MVAPVLSMNFNSKRFNPMIKELVEEKKRQEAEADKLREANADTVLDEI